MDASILLDRNGREAGANSIVSLLAAAFFNTKLLARVDMYDWTQERQYSAFPTSIISMGRTDKLVTMIGKPGSVKEED
jgi:hypothetical protein